MYYHSNEQISGNLHLYLFLYFLLKYCDPDTLQKKVVSADLAAADRRYPNDSVQWITEKIPLSDFPEADFYAAIPVLREKCGDRAVLRAVHFYQENERVPQQVAALENGDFDKFLALVKESGFSSFMYLQNVYARPEDQSLSLALAMAEHMLEGKGAWRVHGGGFGGTTQNFVPVEMLDTFKTTIEQVFGEGSCHVLNIRPYGGVCVDKLV